MNLEFLFTVAVIAPDPPASRKLYVDALGLALESHGDNYHHKQVAFRTVLGAGSDRVLHCAEKRTWLNGGCPWPAGS